MGCVFSKHFGDSNPRFFQVWNVDDHGNQLNPGKIEVTRVDLVLHQKGKTPIRWPLRCLRRYGFDAELFSFESGRRCPTGPGIYAFKCRQAETLFNTVQEFIQCRSSAVGPGLSASGSGMTSPNEERVGSVSGPSPNPNNVPNSASTNTVASYPSGPVINGTGPSLPAPLSVDNVGYLEPIGVAAAVAVAASQPRSGSLSSTSQPETVVNAGAVSPARSSLPGQYNVTATTVSLGLTTTCNCAACNALTRAVTTPTLTSLPHQYVNSSVVVPEKVNSNNNVLTNGVSRDPFYVNGQLPCLAPPPSTIAYVDQNTNYARLDDLLKQEQQHSAKRQKDNNSRFYENVTPEPTVNIVGLNGKMTSSASSTNRGLSGITRVMTSPTGLTAPKSPVAHFYANLNSPPTPIPVDPNPSEFKGQDDPVEIEPDLSEDEPRVNYITLDLNHSQPSTDTNEGASSPPANGTVPSTGLSPPGSPGNPAEGYATIDFDKTAALSNSSNNPGILDDSVRKTRHNSAVPVPISLTLQ